MPEAQTVNSKLTPSIPLEKTLTAKKQIDELIIRAYNSINYNDFSVDYANIWSWAEEVLKLDEVTLIKKLDPFALSQIEAARKAGKNAEWERQRLELLELEAYLLILINKVDQDSAPASIHEVVSRYEEAMAENSVTPDQKNRLIQNLNACYSHLNYSNQIIQKITLVCQDNQLSSDATQEIVQICTQNPLITYEEILPTLHQNEISKASKLAGQIVSQLESTAPPKDNFITETSQPSSPLSVHQLIQQSASAALKAHGVELSADQTESLITHSQTYPPDQLDSVLTQFTPQLSSADRKQLSQTLVIDQIIGPSLHVFLSTHSTKPEEAVILIQTLSDQLRLNPQLLSQPEVFSHTISEKTHLPATLATEIVSGLTNYLTFLSQTATSANLIPQGSTPQQIISSIVTPATEIPQQNFQTGISVTNSVLSSVLSLLPDQNSPIGQVLAVDILSRPQTVDQYVDDLMKNHPGKSRQDMENLVLATLNQPVVAQYYKSQELVGQLFQKVPGLNQETQTVVLNQIINSDSSGLDKFLASHPEQNTDILTRIQTALLEASPAVIQSSAITASQIATQDTSVGQLVQQIFIQNPQASVADIKDFLISHNIDSKQATLVSKSAYNAFRSASTSVPIIITPPTQPAPQAVVALVRNQLQQDPAFSRLPTKIQNELFSNIQKVAAEKGSQLSESDIRNVFDQAKLSPDLSSQAAFTVYNRLPQAVSQTTSALNSALNVVSTLATQYQFTSQQSESAQSVVQMVLSSQPNTSIPQLSDQLVRQVGISKYQATTIAGNAIFAHTLQASQIIPTISQIPVLITPSPTIVPQVELIAQILTKQTLISSQIQITPEIQSQIKVFAQNVSSNPTSVNQHLQTFISSLKLTPSQSFSPSQISQLGQSIITASTAVSPASVIINHVLTTAYTPQALVKIQPQIAELARISVTSTPQKIQQYIDQNFIPEVSRILGLPINPSASRQISDRLIKLSQTAPTLVPTLIQISQAEGFSPKESRLISSSTLDFIVTHPLASSEQLNQHLQSLRLGLTPTQTDRAVNLTLLASNPKYSPSISLFVRSLSDLPPITNITPQQFDIYSQTYEKFIKLSGVPVGSDQFRILSGLTPLIVSGLAQQPIETLGSLTSLVQSVSPQSLNHLSHLANITKDFHPVLQNLYLTTNNSLVFNNLINPAQAHEISLRLLLFKTANPDASIDQVQSYLEKQYKFIPKNVSRSVAQQVSSFRLHFDLTKAKDVDLFIHQTLTSEFSRWIPTQAATKISQLFVEHNLHNFIYNVLNYHSSLNASPAQITQEKSVILQSLMVHGLSFLSQKYPQHLKSIFTLINIFEKTPSPINTSFQRIYQIFNTHLGKFTPVFQLLSGFSPQNLIAVGQSYFLAYTSKTITQPLAQIALGKFFTSQVGKNITSLAARYGIKIGAQTASKAAIKTAISKTVTTALVKSAAKITAKIGVKALAHAITQAVGTLAPIIGNIIAFIAVEVVFLIPRILSAVLKKSKELAPLAVYGLTQIPLLRGSQGNSLRLSINIPSVIFKLLILPFFLGAGIVMILIPLIVFIINNSAYVVPYTVNQLTYNATPTPYPIDKIGPPPPTPRPPGWGTGPIAGFGGGGSGGGSFNCSSSCPIQKGRITTTSYNASNESGHGSNAYWNAMCGNGGCTACFAYSLPQSTGCTGPSSGVANPANICYQNPTTNKCPTYGYAIDVFPSTDSNVYLPLLNGQSVTWSSCGGFLNPCRPGVTPGTCVGVTAFYCSGSSKIILTHINSGYLTGVYPSGTQIGSLFPQGGNTHLHLEAIINGSYVPPENYFCSGDTAVCAPIGVNCWCATIGCTPGSCWWSDAASAGPYICPNISCGPYIPPQPTSTPVPTTCNFPNYCLSSQRECYDDFGGVVGPRYNCPSGQFCCITQ